MKQISGPGSIRDRVTRLVHWDDLGGWDREEGGKGFWMGNTYNSWDDYSREYGKNY